MQEPRRTLAVESLIPPDPEGGFEGPVPLARSPRYEASRVVPLFTLETYGPQSKYLGGGTFGDVWAHGEFAIKSFKPRNEEGYPPISRDVLREVAIMLRCNHPTITPILDIILYRSRTPYYRTNYRGETVLSYILTSYETKMVLPMALGSLDSFISNEDRWESLEESDSMKGILYGLTAALAYLHSRGIMHRDIKPGNILIFPEGERYKAQLADFGLAVTYGCLFPRELQEKNFTGAYASPEMILSNVEPEDIPQHEMFPRFYTQQADLWALGCTFYELLAQDSDPPFYPKGIPESRLFNGPYFTYEFFEITVQKAKQPSVYGKKILEKVHSLEAVRLVQNFLQIEPDDRVSAYEALEDPYFSDYRDDPDTEDQASLLFDLARPPSCDQRLKDRTAQPVPPKSLEKAPYDKLRPFVKDYERVLVAMRRTSKNYSEDDSVYHQALWIFDAWVSTLMEPTFEVYYISYGIAALQIALTYAGYVVATDKLTKLVFEVTANPTEVSLAVGDLLRRIRFDILQANAWYYLQAYKIDKLMENYLYLLTLTPLRFYYPPSMLADTARDLRTLFQNRKLQEVLGAPKIDHPSVILQRHGHELLVLDKKRK